MLCPIKVNSNAIFHMYILYCLSQGTVVLRVSRQLLTRRARDRIPAPTFFCGTNDLDARSKNELETEKRHARGRPLTRERARTRGLDRELLRGKERLDSKDVE